MFPDSNIAGDYSQEDTKTNYIVQFFVAPYINDTLVKDLTDTPFVFKFDKTTTQQINKQYDSFFVSYYSSRFQRIFTNYVRSLFAGDFKSDDLVSHFFEFIEKPELHVDFLLALSMDSPNVNRFFEKKIAKRTFRTLFNKSTKFLDVGSCPLHSVDNTFLEGSKELKNIINLNQFVLDMHFSLNILQHVEKIIKVL